MKRILRCLVAILIGLLPMQLSAQEDYSSQLTTIPDSMFWGMQTLQTMVIGPSITHIEKSSLNITKSTKPTLYFMPIQEPTVDWEAADWGGYRNCSIFLPYQGEYTIGIEFIAGLSAHAFKYDERYYDVSGVETVRVKPEWSYRCEGGVLTLDGKDPGDWLVVYDMNGRFVAKTRESAIAGLPKGVYIVSVSKNHFKIAVR